MTQDKIAALLGRPLSSTEQSNFKLYLELAQGRVSDLLCFDICQKVETRRFSARDGYRTLNVPIFTEIDSERSTEPKRPIMRFAQVPTFTGTGTTHLSSMHLYTAKL